MSKERWRSTIPYDERRASRGGIIARLLLLAAFVAAVDQGWKHREGISKEASSAISAIQTEVAPTATFTATPTESATETAEARQSTVPPDKRGVSETIPFEFDTAVTITLFNDTKTESHDKEAFQTFTYYGNLSRVNVDTESIFTGGGDIAALECRGTMYRVNPDGSLIGPINGVFITGHKHLLRLSSAKQSGELDVSSAQLPQVRRSTKSPLLLERIYGRIQVAYITQEGALRIDEEYLVSDNSNYVNGLPPNDHNSLKATGLYTLGNDNVAEPLIENAGVKIFRGRSVTARYATEEPERYHDNYPKSNGTSEPWPRSFTAWPGFIIYEGMDIEVTQ